MKTADNAMTALAAQGGDFVEPALLIEAAVPLELSGEAVRSRICTFVDGQSIEWALRPDLTLPVAQAECDLRGETELGETCRRYRGPVFRLPAVEGDPIEYEQVGLERFGAPSDVERDVWLFQTLIEASEACGVETGHTCFGDLSVFSAFVDALGFPEDVSAGLKRAFRQEGGVRAYLAGQKRNQSGLPARVSGMSRTEIAAFIEDIFAITGVRPVGNRSADEIVERLHARSSIGASFEISAEQSELLERVLTLDVAYAEAPSVLRSIAKDGGLSGVESTLARFSERTERLMTLNSAFTQTAQFATRFGRRFTYYDGFVFEIAASADETAKQRPFVAGGRYDSLLSDLSKGRVEATALGGIIIPHRVENLLGGRS
ncbi:MAG: ATP phosphoribosyltransferase regulatory subunit [Pseudomonadota bacterium]